MYPARFDYHTPRSLAEALDLLHQHGDDAKILAGGHSIVPAMKLRRDTLTLRLLDMTSLPINLHEGYDDCWERATPVAHRPEGPAHSVAYDPALRFGGSKAAA